MFRGAQISRRNPIRLSGRVAEPARFAPPQPCPPYQASRPLELDPSWGRPRWLRATPKRRLRELYRARFEGRMGTEASHYVLVPNDQVTCSPLLHEEGLGQQFAPTTLRPNSSDLLLTFLGTSSGGMSTQRSNTSMALRTPEEGLWIFDAGEGTSHNLCLSPLKPGTVNKIFITHLHSDHAAGLPALVITLLDASDQKQTPITVVGPVGVRQFLLHSLGAMLTQRRSGAPLHLPRLHIVELQPAAPTTYKFSKMQSHEASIRAQAYRAKGPDDTASAQDQPAAAAADFSHDWCWPPKPRDRFQASAPLPGHKALEADSRIPVIGSQTLVEPVAPQQVLGDDCPWQAPVWVCHASDKYLVVASPLLHTVPCFGYTIIERDSPRSLAALSKMKLPIAARQTLQAGGDWEGPDGQVVRYEDVAGGYVPGRKIVILGDTRDSRMIYEVARGADLLVHEATVYGDEGVDWANRNKHSVAAWAGHMAGRLQVRLLMLTHISARYQRPNTSWDAVSPLEELVEEAEARLKQIWPSGDVILAEDFLEVRVARHKPTQPSGQRFFPVDPAVERRAQRILNKNDRSRNNKSSRREAAQLRQDAEPETETLEADADAGVVPGEEVEDEECEAAVNV